MNGTPAAVRKATVEMPLSSTRNPIIWERARRRVTRSRKPTSTIVMPTGTAKAAGPASASPPARRAATPVVASMIGRLTT